MECEILIESGSNRGAEGAASATIAVTMPGAAQAAQPRQCWVLLRGLARESGHWGNFPAVLLRELAQQADVELLLMDLPGNGVLYRQASPLSVPAMVEACRAELARRGRRQGCYLLAMSLGGMVACDWAYRYPEEVLGTVLINTSMQPYQPLLGRVRPASYWKLLALGLLKLGVRWRESRVLALTSRLVKEPQPVLDRWVELQRQHPVRRRNGLRQLLAAIRFRARRVGPTVPVLLLCSKSDQLIDWHCSQALSRAWGVPLRLHTQAGHDLPLDDPQWVAAAVVQWLDARQMHALGDLPGRRSAAAGA